VLPVVPMFHANAWGIAFSAPAVGAKLVLPGAKMDGESIYELLDGEKVSLHGRRADRVADAAPVSRSDRQEAART
jgi:acyl-CoA synthetase (AMP-forming)/AMP-acid ligase II